ncbi:F-box domain containing protein [Trema orientale]|uniref:F-box domain containing protein n=1 Tax=Trema orientale TaxID=63057 RepID=A0A2P5DFR7_TREOI|nr:F-box domain containing protein [Trema orientale]
MELVVCNSKSDERAGAAACKFTDDIIEEILLRLDAQSVMRCKCVCKSWLSLITHPSFKHRHLKHQVPGIVLHNVCVYTPFWIHRIGSESFWCHECPEDIDDKSRVKDSWYVVVMGSQNGVICLSYVRNRRFYLWNPSVRKIRKLPPSPPPTTRCLVMHGGFGYDALTDDFKVVYLEGYAQGIYVNYFRVGNLVGVYSLRSDSWKTLEMPDLFSDHHPPEDSSSSTLVMVTDPSCSLYCCSLVVNGSIHWLIHYGRRKLVASIPYKEKYLDYVGIVAFDMSTEVFKRIDAPSPSLRDGFKAIDVHSIFDWSGCLSLVIFERPSSIRIWVMKQYGVSDSWTKHFSADVSNSPVPPSIQSHQNIGLAAFYSNGDMLLDYTDSYCLYNSKSNKVEYLSPASDVAQFTGYVESIFLS